jgi:hypothetical protein
VFGFPNRHFVPRGYVQGDSTLPTKVLVLGGSAPSIVRLEVCDTIPARYLDIAVREFGDLVLKTLVQPVNVGLQRCGTYNLIGAAGILTAMLTRACQDSQRFRSDGNTDRAT